MALQDARFFNIGLPQLPTNTDTKIEPDLRDIFNSLRNLAYLVGQYGGFEEPDDLLRNAGGYPATAGVYKRRIYSTAAAACSYGQLLNIHDVAGASYVRPADATAGVNYYCNGICNTPGVTAIGGIVEVVLPGCYVSSIGGLVHGTRYFLAPAAGGLLTAAEPVGVGQTRQAIGFGFDSSMFFFWPDMGWWLV